MRSIFFNIINGLFILLFTYTAFSKLLAYERFKFVLSTAPLVRNFATGLAVIIPAAELIIAGLICIPSSAKKGLIAGTCLLVIFTAYLAYMIFTDPDLPCSCGGVIQQLSWKEHIPFNIFFIAAGLSGIYMQPNKSNTPAGV